MPATVTIHEAKTHLSRLLKRVELGEEIIIVRGKKPIAVLKSLPQKKQKRQIDFDENFIIYMVDDFDEPLAEFAEYMP